MCVKQELVCVCRDKDRELCGRGRSGNLREAWLSSLQLGGRTVQQGGGVSTHTHTHTTNLSVINLTFSFETSWLAEKVWLTCCLIADENKPLNFSLNLHISWKLFICTETLPCLLAFEYRIKYINICDFIAWCHFLSQQVRLQSRLNRLLFLTDDFNQNKVTADSADIHPTDFLLNSCSTSVVSSSLSWLCRYRTYMRPRYKVAYKMVTEMEWKCCHGYSGEDCNDGPVGGSQISTTRPQPRPGGGTLGGGGGQGGGGVPGSGQSGGHSGEWIVIFIYFIFLHFWTWNHRKYFRGGCTRPGVEIKLRWAQWLQSPMIQQTGSGSYFPVRPAKCWWRFNTHLDIIEQVNIHSVKHHHGENRPGVPQVAHWSQNHNVVSAQWPYMQYTTGNRK